MVLIRQSQLKQIISEIIATELRRLSVLNESQESESIKGATLLYMKRTGKSKEEADKFIRIDLRATFPPLRDKKIGKFILGVTRMYLDGQLRDATTIANLNSTLKYVGDPTHINEYDRNLNGMSAQDLIERFAPARMQDMEKDKAELGKTQYTAKNEYKVVRIDSFEQARQYGKYNNWCLAQPSGEDMFDTYTSDGVNQLYIILRDGFENEPRKVGPNAPYDSYGLSMMTVIVDPYGQMTQSTTRWNHENGSSDSAFTPKTMSEVIGRNFYEVFKPNTKFKDALEDALGRLRNAEDANDMFDSVGDEQDGMRFVELMRKWNYLTKDNRILMSQWVDYANDFHEGFGNIFIKGKGWNYINAKGEIISKTWVDNPSDFHNGFARVNVDGKGYNFINTKGEIISETWFNGVGDFRDGFARVYVKGKGYNFINTKGEFLSETWFDNAYDFHDGFGLIFIEGKGWNYINAKGELISKTWFNYAYRFHDGFGHIYIKEKGYNYINTKGEIISKNWFDGASDFQDGFGLISIKEKGYNYINTKGEIISKNWFDYARDFYDGFAIVNVDGKGYNFINTKGELISKIWFDYVYAFYEGISRVYVKEKGYNFINANGEFLSRSWFNGGGDFHEGFGAIIVNGKGWNFINTKGDFLSEIWFDYVSSFKNGFAYVKKNGKTYDIDRNGTLYDYNKKIPVTLNEEAIKEIVRKVLMESLDKRVMNFLRR